MRSVKGFAMIVPTRRRFLGDLGLLGLAALPLAGCVTAEPAPAIARFRAVEVDAGPFAAKGVPNYAARVAAATRAAVPATFAGRIDPTAKGAPVLTLEIASVKLAAWTGSGRGSSFDRFGGSSDATDWIDGALVVRSASGAVIDRRPHIASLPSSSSGFWYDPENEEKRMRALAAAYAWWAAKEYPN
jgi:hypothetical protein